MKDMSFFGCNLFVKKFLSCNLLRKYNEKLRKLRTSFNRTLTYYNTYFVVKKLLIYSVLRV